MDASYNRGKFLLADGQVDWDTDTINVLLLDNAGTYAFSADHNHVADLGANELSGAGYTRKTLTAAAPTEDDTNDRAGLDAGTAAGLVVFKQVTGDTDSPLLGYIDGGFPFTSNGGDLTVQFDAAGVFTVS